MVNLFPILFQSANRTTKRNFRKGFIDTLRFTVKGGHGGNGLPKYGGVGGQGGCVYFVAKENLTLEKVAQKYREKRVSASHGEDSSKIRILGRRGEDLRVEVPVGVRVLKDNGEVLGDLNEEEAVCIAAGGGKGGCTGTSFLGRPGEERVLNLDLKLIADIGLVGFPNAGKSTLLKSLSNAKPKIASYPFTTIRPQLGTIHFNDLRVITVADLPGLIEGAHANFGMGHKFLKHVERTRLLLFMVDIFGFQLSPRHKPRNCIENIYSLNKELELYDESILDKPCVLLINKMDKPGAREIYKNIKPTIENLEDGLKVCPEELRPKKLIQLENVLFISAKHSEGIDNVKTVIRDTLDNIAEAQTVPNELELTEVLQVKASERGPRIT